MAPIFGVPRTSLTTPLTVAGKGAAEADKSPATVITISVAIWESLLRTQIRYSLKTRCSNKDPCAQSYSFQPIRALVNRKRSRLRHLLLRDVIINCNGHLVLTRLQAGQRDRPAKRQLIRVGTVVSQGGAGLRCV